MSEKKRVKKRNQARLGGEICWLREQAAEEGFSWLFDGDFGRVLANWAAEGRRQSEEGDSGA